MMINDIVGSTVGGTVATGVVQIGDKLVLMPTRIECTVKGVTNMSVTDASAQAGHSVKLTLDCDPEMLQYGF